MFILKNRYRLVVFIALLVSMPGWGATPLQPAPLPNAPMPQPAAAFAAEKSGRESALAIPQSSSSGHGSRVFAPIYDRVVFPGELAHRLTARNKFIFAARQTIEPINLTPAIISAGYGQYTNDDPKFGTSNGAFADRFGVAVLRQDSYRLLADGFMPILLREDPRYYRLGRGSLLQRFGYAIGQTFVTRNDVGHTLPNYAGILGRGVASSLTMAYYPAVSANARVVLSTFGTSIAGDAGLNIIRELLPEPVFKKLKSLHLRVTGQ